MKITLAGLILAMPAGTLFGQAVPATGAAALLTHKLC